MAVWSYVYGTIPIDAAGRDDVDTDYRVSRVIGSLPPVTGSEYNMSMHVVKPSVPDSWINADVYLNPLDANKCPSGNREDTSQRMLLVEGKLRDRTFDETNRAFVGWLSRLANRCMVDDILVTIHDDIGRRECVYDYRQMETWLRGLYEPIWLRELRDRTLYANGGKSTRAFYYQGYGMDCSGTPITYHQDEHVYRIDNVHDKVYHKLDRYDVCGL